MWSRKRPDIGWRDLLCGACRVALPPDREAAASRVERLWPDSHHTLACLSVRTGFDLLLSALNLPRGGKALVSAVTIPDMVRIVEHHGLVPVPVDLDPETMAPRIDQWQQAVSPDVKLILTAHLFGGRAPMTPLLALARERGLIVVEDCAQAFSGTDYQGHPEADASLFSFGPIKSSTALGGAVLRVRNPELLTRMRTLHDAYPVQPSNAYFARLAKYAALKVLACRPVCGVFVGACRLAGCDYDRRINRAARGFPGTELFAQIRQQPSAALLAVLERRLRRYDRSRWRQHTAKGVALAANLREFVDCPGSAVSPHTYWVFPMIAEEPERLIEHLARAGFDATQGQSLCVVSSDRDAADHAAPVAAELLAKMVFLPFYPELPPQESQRLAASVRAFIGWRQLRPTSP